MIFINISLVLHSMEEKGNGLGGETTSVKINWTETTWKTRLGHSNAPDLRLLIRVMEFANTPFVTSNNNIV